MIPKTPTNYSHRNPMKNIAWVKAASLSTLFAAALTAPALAGSTYVENDYSIRNIYNGRSRTNVKIDSNYEFDRKAYSRASKKGTSFTETDQISKGDVDKVWQDQTFAEVDDFRIDTASKSIEVGDGFKRENIRVQDSYSYNGIDKTHRVTSGYDY